MTEATPDVRVFAGIDEAGLGPILGPLSIGYSAFRSAGPPRFRTRLAGCVTQDRKRSKTHLLVADSKQVFDRTPRGAERLENTVLAFGAQLRGDPFGPVDASAPRWLERSAAITGSPLPCPRHPWYAHFPTRLVIEPKARTAGAKAPAAAPTGLELGARATRLTERLDAGGLEVVDLGFALYPSGALNDSYAVTDNKSQTLWNASARVLERLFERFGAEGLEVWMDRQGGRLHYAEQLERTLPFAHLRVLREARSGCEYRVTQGERRLVLHVREKAEDHSFAVALGSCCAKYGRELAMSAFNTYFGEFEPGLRPTAGYYTDGMRWLEEAGRALQAAGMSPSRLIRKR